jgi:hypothetical protein
MRLVTTSMFALAFIAVACTAAYAAPVVIFQDNYEGYAVGTDLPGQTAPIGSYQTPLSPNIKVADASTEADPGATNSGKFAADRSSGMFVVPAGGALTNHTVKFQWDAWVSDLNGGSSGGQDPGTFDSTNWVPTGAGWNITLATNGNVSWYGPATPGDAGANNAVVVGTFATDTWVPVTVTADYAAQTFTASVGTLNFSGNIRTDLGPTNKTFGAMFMTRDGSSGSGNFEYFDNLVITDMTPVPEPSTIALLVSGVVALVAYAWRKRK